MLSVHPHRPFHGAVAPRAISPAFFLGKISAALSSAQFAEYSAKRPPHICTEASNNRIRDNAPEIDTSHSHVSAATYAAAGIDSTRA